MSTEQAKESLAARFERHADQEGAILDEYRVFAEKLGNSAAGMLVDQILTDEEVHHLLLRAIAKALRAHAAGRAPEIPHDANRAELLRIAHTLQKHERQTIDACGVLRAQLSGESDEHLRVLVDAMALDSEKHHGLLTAVVKMLQT